MVSRQSMKLTSRQRDVLESLQEGSKSSSDIGHELNLSSQTVRSHVSNLKEKGVEIEYDPEIKKYHLKSEDVKYYVDEEVDDEEFVEDLESGITLEEFESEYGIANDGALEIMKRLRQKGYTIEFKEINNYGKRLYYIPEETDKQFKVGDGEGEYRFGLISDTHLGSSAEHLEELHDYYDRLVEEGIDTVFHCGDIGDGWKIHKGHINVIKGEASGWDRLLDYIVDNYPKREGIDTFFIEGNHDNRYHRNNGIHFGELIDDEREDLHYCGDSMARFVFDQENDIDMEIIHPSGGQPYTAAYRLQTLYRERPADDRPTIAAVGHLHGSVYAETEGVKGFYAGCWKGLTTYGKRKGHNATVGGWIIDLEIENGEVRSLTPDWISYDADNTTNNFSMQEIDNMRTRQT